MGAETVEATEETQQEEVEQEETPGESEAEEEAETEEEAEEDDSVPHGALHAERERRKEAERSADYWQGIAKEADAERRDAPTQPDETDYEALGISKEAADAMAGRAAGLDHDQRVLMSEELAEVLFDDYGEVMGPFLDKLRANPALQRVIKNKALPAVAAYRAAKGLIETEKEKADTNTDEDAAKAEGRKEAVDKITAPRPKGLKGAKRATKDPKDLTPEDAADLSQEDWDKLEPSERRRLLMG